ncbi:Survival protein SurA precursor (Peptidyl-prolyl cis-trans isomerase SurA) [hydrothermal vent metagenome]|uniref:Periplasmic chaperone PpiD n=1 Tax=hydrothermal vent metagenome TaxID=652676 RepID=A0A3B1BUB0_9ZZZZ
MLTIFREAAKSWVSKILIWFVAVTFVGAAFLVWGRGSESSDEAVANVGGQNISRYRFTQRVRQVENMFRDQFQGQIDLSLLKTLNAPALAMNSLIEHALQIDAAKKAGFVVTDLELGDAIKSMPEFEFGGSFDSRRYAETLQRTGLTPKAFENNMRKDILIQKLKSMVERGALVTDIEVYNKYMYDYRPIIVEFAKVNADDLKDRIETPDSDIEKWFNDRKGRFLEPESRSFRMLMALPSSFVQKVELTEQDIEDYYSSHIAEFEIKEEAHARHILATVSPSATEKEAQAAKARVERARERVLAGEDFAEVAKDMSQGPSASKGGDLGSFGKGMMVPEFEKVVFDLAPGEVSQPFRTDFGWHIAKTITRTKGKIPPLEEVRNRVIDGATKQKARVEAKAFMETIKVGLKPDNFGAITDERPEVTINSFNIKKGEIIESIQEPVAVSEVVFDISEKRISDVIDLPEGFAIVMVDSIEPPHTPPFDTIRSAVEEKYKEDKSMKLAEEIASKIEKAVNEGEDMVTVAQAEGVKVATTEPFSRTTIRDTTRLKSEGMVMEAFELADGEAQIAPGYRGYVVIAVSSRPALDEKEMASKVKEIREELRQRKRAQVYAEYMASLRKKAEEQGLIAINIDLNSQRY